MPRSIELAHMLLIFLIFFTSRAPKNFQEFAYVLVVFTLFSFFYRRSNREVYRKKDEQQDD